MKAGAREIKESDSSNQNPRTFLSALYGAPKKTALPKSFTSLASKYADLYKQAISKEKEEQEKPAIPYYVDTRSNTFSILGSKDLVPEDPYDIALATVIGNEGEAFISYFQDDGVNEVSKPILMDFVKFISKTRHGVCEMAIERGRDASSILLKAGHRHLANLIWENEVGQHLLIPKKRVESYIKTSKDGSTDTIVRDLRKKLASYNSGPHKERMANAFIHLLESAYQASRTLEGQDGRWGNFLSFHKDFIPTWPMLEMKGLIPDVKVRKYESLFLAVEWEAIKSSKLFELEEEIRNLMLTSLTAESVPRVIKRLEEIRNLLRDNRLSNEIRSVRRERLLQISRLEGGKASKKSVSQKVKAAWGNDKVRQAWNAFRIPFAAEMIKTSTQVCLSHVYFDEERGFYTFDDKAEVVESQPGYFSALAANLADFLNK